MQRDERKAARDTFLDKPIYVESVYLSGQCHGCGVCQGACPVDAVRMEQDRKGNYHPLIVRGGCIDCDICVDVCSGVEWNTGSLDGLFVRRGENSSYQVRSDQYIGSYRSIRVGYSTDAVLRSAGSSGGVATAILLYALEKGLIDGAVTVGPDPENPLHPKARISRTRDELLYCSKSIYSMVELGTPIFEELSEKKERFAVVGLACHIASLRKAQERLEALKRNCILLVGLMDGHNVTHHLTEYFLHKNRMRLEDVQEVRYRGSKWWNYDIAVRTRNGELSKFNFAKSAFSVGWEAKILIPQKCMRCTDFAAELADISLADAWLRRYKDTEEGYSIVVGRSSLGQSLLDDMISADRLIMEDSSVEALHESNAHQIDFKKRTVQARERIYQIFGSPPSKNEILKRETYELRPIDYVAAFEHVIINSFSLVLAKYSLMKLVPVAILKKYRRWKIHRLLLSPLIKLFNFLKRRAKNRFVDTIAHHLDFDYLYLHK
jgi:coenzyme F420 hydrogenase subunit beta